LISDLFCSAIALKVTHLRGNMVSVDQHFYYEEKLCFHKSQLEQHASFERAPPLPPSTTSVDAKKAVASFGTLLKQGTLSLEIAGTDSKSNGDRSRQHVSLLAFRGSLVMMTHDENKFGVSVDTANARKDPALNVSPTSALTTSGVEDRDIVSNCAMKAELLAGDRWIARQVIEVGNVNHHSAAPLGLSLDHASLDSRRRGKSSNDNVLLLTLRLGVSGAVSRWQLHSDTRVVLEEWLWALRHSDLGHGLLTGMQCAYIIAVRI